MTTPETTDLFPEPDLPRAHSRNYEVRAYRRPDGRLLVRGAVRDVLPAGFYDGVDPEPMVMHHMVVDLVVDTPSLVIAEAEVVFEEFPHGSCPSITGHYGNLIGLNVARGFTHKVRELFGGPRGCTHTTALLQAMAPVVVQAHLGSFMRSLHDGGDGGASSTFRERLASPEGRERRAAGNRNTCHLWAEDGPHLAAITETGAVMLPLPIVRRLRERGVDPETWQETRRLDG
jgi:hypothetical protein